MERLLAALGDDRGSDDPTAQAQDVTYEAWEQTTGRSRIALAKALGISPLCVDACVLLAGEAWLASHARRSRVADQDRCRLVIEAARTLAP